MMFTKKALTIYVLFPLKMIQNYALHVTHMTLELYPTLMKSGNVRILRIVAKSLDASIVYWIAKQHARYVKEAMCLTLLQRAVIDVKQDVKRVFLHSTV